MNGGLIVIVCLPLLIILSPIEKHNILTLKHPALFKLTDGCTDARTNGLEYEIPAPKRSPAGIKINT